jgi:hypothetical protein
MPGAVGGSLDGGLQKPCRGRDRVGRRLGPAFSGPSGPQRASVGLGGLQGVSADTGMRVKVMVSVEVVVPVS